MSGIVSRLLAPMKRWFGGLQRREQSAILLLSAFIVILFLWMEVWQPVDAARDKSEASYQVALADLEWMRAHTEQAKSLRVPANTKVASDGSSLLTLVTDSAQPYHIEISHAEPTEDGSLHLSLDSVPFSHLLSWLDTMQREHDIKTSQITIERQTAKPGYVSANLTLQTH